MPSLSVIVYRNGSVQPNAKVRLDGVGQTKFLTTNSAGAVCFAGLISGTYIVNAAHGPDFLGVGHVALKPDKPGVIFIRYPRLSRRKGSLRVQVVGRSGAIAMSRVVISGPTSQSRESSHGEAVTFSRIPPGQYSVTGSAVDAGMLVRNSVSVNVLPGSGRSVTIRLAGLPPTPKRRLPYRSMSVTDLKTRISKLDKELKTLSEKIHRLQDAAEVRENYRRKAWKPGGHGGLKDGSTFADLADHDRAYSRRQEIKRYSGEYAGKNRIKEALEEALALKPRGPGLAQ